MLSQQTSHAAVASGSCGRCIRCVRPTPKGRGVRLESQERDCGECSLSFACTLPIGNCPVRSYRCCLGSDQCNAGCLGVRPYPPGSSRTPAIAHTPTRLGLHTAHILECSDSSIAGASRTRCEIPPFLSFRVLWTAPLSTRSKDSRNFACVSCEGSSGILRMSCRSRRGKTLSSPIRQTFRALQ